MSVTIETRPTISRIGHIGYLTDGLIAYWKCDEGSGLTIADSVGGHTGTLSNATFYATGKLGTCVEGNYFGDYIQFNDSGALNQIYDQVTISFWTKLNSLPMTYGYYSYFLNCRKSDNLNTGIGIYISEIDNRIYFVADGNFSNSIYSSVITNITTWFHVVCISSGIGQNYKIYINNVDDTQRVWGPTIPINNSFGSVHQILNNGASHGLNGYMDEIGIWSRALTLTERTTLYNGGTGLTYPF
jgi:hypothetical protein